MRFDLLPSIVGGFEFYLSSLNTSDGKDPLIPLVPSYHQSCFLFLKLKGLNLKMKVSYRIELYFYCGYLTHDL